MKINFKTSATLFLAGLLVFSSCKQKEEEETAGAIELSGDQNTPRTLENRFESLTTPDYIVRGTFSVNAAVTIEPGTVIVMAPGSQIVVDGSGSLKSVGTAALPIRFTGESKSAGSWNKILFMSNNANNQMVYTIVEHGGGDGSYDASVYCYQNGRLAMSNSTIRNGNNYGILVYTPEFTLSDFSDNTIHDIQLAPALIQPSHIDLFDGTFSAYDNGYNRIEVDYGEIGVTKTIHSTMVPYFIRSGNIEVVAPVELEPGVNMTMGPGSGFSVSGSGSFKAIGTVSNPITITGEQSVNGYWNSIRFIGSNNLNNEFQYCTISYGGGNTSWDAMLYLYDNSRMRIGNSLISDSQTYGIMNYGGSNTLVDDGNNVFSNNQSGDIGN